MDELVIYAPTGMIGSGISRKSVNTAIENYDIDYVIADGGSIDAGPNYLGQAITKPPKTTKRDMRIILEISDKCDVPVLVGTTGFSGSRTQVDEVSDLVKEIAKEDDYDFSLTRIYSDIDNSDMGKYIENNQTEPLSHGRKLTKKDAENAKRIVAQIGIKPFIDALDKNSDVILAGRSLDISPFAAAAIHHGFDKGLAIHLAKILECGPMAADKNESKTNAESMIGIIKEDYAEIGPPEPGAKCTTESVASHMLYEKSDPHTIYTPSGQVNLTDTKLEETKKGKVRISGSEYQSHENRSFLLEGVEKSGYRSIMVCGVRGPIILDKLDDILKDVRVRTNTIEDKSNFELTFRTYGANATSLANNETESESTPEEVGIIIDVVAETQTDAYRICQLTNDGLRHHDFNGKIATSGNLAIPYSPAVINVGEVYNFSIYHLLSNVQSNTITQVNTEVVK